jgi:DNA repair ATPase RecN
MREICNAEWDDIQDRLKEKDAEIERLRGVVEDLSDHGVAAERMERLKAQGKEIERLKSWNQTLKQIVADDPEKHFYKVLLTRAADALERAPVLPPKMIEALKAELRKAAE